MLIVNEPSSGAINLDGVICFKVAGAMLTFYATNVRIEIDCDDEISACVAYKLIVSAYVAGEKVVNLAELRRDVERESTSCVRS